MRVLIDTNVLISASLNGQSVSYLAYAKAVTSPNKGMVCDQNIDEMRRVYNRKFPNKIHALESFLAQALAVLEVVPTPADDLPIEETVRDTDDRPILRAAIAAQADVLLTGDKDFLESGIAHPRILSPTQFLQI